MSSNNNFFALLQARFLPFSEKVCFSVPGGRALTYGDIDAMSAQMAGALLEAGAKPGDRVLAQIEKSVENVALYLGAIRAGLIYVPLNTSYTTAEVEYFLNDAEPTICVCDPKKVDAFVPLAQKTGVKYGMTLDAKGEGTLTDLARDAEPFDKIQTRHENDLAVILYTSGTTGRSKGAMLSHGNLSSNAITLNTLWGFQQNDVLLHALPIFHIHGLFVALHTAMLSACEIIFMPKFDVGEVRKNMNRATVMMGVPTFYSRLLAEPDFDEEDTANIRLFVSGSAPLTEETFNAFAERTGQKILERYGMSEAGMITSNPLTGDRIAGTVGYPLPDVSVRIVSDDGKIANADEPGGVQVKGPNVFKGYWKKPEKTAEELTGDGFFKTGDIGALSTDSRLTLIGRSKDLIIAGGYNIYPKEIEQVLDAISGIEESAVVGVPHPDMGEGVVAVIVGNAEQKAIDDALTSLAKFKRPRKFFTIDALPRNAMGKVQKQVLRETYKAAFSA